MRLSREEQAAIRQAVLRRDPQAQIFLYGSRAKNYLKGGDIDLLIISATLGFSDKIDLLIELKEQMGDQKIDLTIKTREAAGKDPFWQGILQEATEIQVTP